LAIDFDFKVTFGTDEANQGNIGQLAIILVSTTKLMNDGWKSGNDTNIRCFVKGSAKLTLA
jgi:hypothetical protein